MEEKNDLSEHPDAKVWWAMSAVFNRSMKAKALLDAAAVENFVPMQAKLLCVGRRRVRKQVPAIRNLIFVHAAAAEVRAVKERCSFLQYLTLRSDGKARPIVVPDEQMRHFIAVAGRADEQLVYLDPASVDLSVGDRVRICSGPFDGVEGVLVKIRGHRDKRVVVAVEGVAAVATATVHPDLLEKIR